VKPRKETTMAIEESDYYGVLVSLKCREAGFPPGHIFDLNPPIFSKQRALENSALFHDAAKEVEHGYFDLPKLPGERD